MDAGAEDSLHEIARDDRVEERPDPVRTGDDRVELRTEVARRARLELLDREVVRAVQEQAVGGDEVGQQLVRRVLAGRRIHGSVAVERRGDHRVEPRAPCRIRQRRAFGGADDIDPDPLRLSPQADREPHRAQHEAVAQRPAAFHLMTRHRA